ncbi:hypothetical protein FB192DRAFT_1378923 [Mucor lusitanicus]|uniref:Uncharacterized protein n=1 Tax=Mucor circinelloides f. lusitanicus TaxID=29924 RepID=A0A8H4BI62_MUCCL|nr:hypothetical protein FB192DRAFT_1378923 [Mucor lusitanicus]
MNITQDRAICMLFYKEFSEENVKQCKQDISSLSGKFQVCYQTSPNEPILVSEFRIFGEPAGDYHLYPEVATAEHQEAIVREECNTCKERQQESPDDVISVNVTETLEEVQKASPSKRDCRFQTSGETLAFINLVFTVHRSNSEFYAPWALYDLNDILASLKKYTAIFDHATTFIFSEWCRAYEPLMGLTDNNGKIFCHTLKEEFLAEAAKNVAIDYLK